MTSPTSVPWYGTPRDWSEIISGAGNAAGSALQSNAAYANSKEEAKEAKRRSLANMLNQSLKRKRALNRASQEYNDEMNDYQSQALQEVARGFVDSLHGSTGGY